MAPLGDREYGLCQSFFVLVYFIRRRAACSPLLVTFGTHLLEYALYLLVSTRGGRGMEECKEIVFGEDARQKLQKGIALVERTVRFTFGPKGKPVGIEQTWGSPKITSDGSSISQEIETDDQYANMGISMVKEAIENMNDSCGDGMTRTVLLLKEFVEQGLRYISADVSAVAVKRGLDKAVKALIAEIEINSTPIRSNEDIEKIAVAASGGNALVGKVIKEAFEKAGKEGVIVIENGQGTETEVVLHEGMRFQRGYSSRAFCNKKSSMTVEFDNAYVLVVDEKLNAIQDLIPLLQELAASGRALVIISEDIGDEILSALILNHLSSVIKVVTVKAPEFGESRKEVLQDLAILSGGACFSESAGKCVKNAKLDDLGSFERVVVDKDSTTLIGGRGDSESIRMRIRQIRQKGEKTQESYRREKLEKRAASLEGGIAAIRVGAPSETEVKHLKQLFSKGLNSARAAQEEGVIAGSGVTLIQLSKCLDSVQVSQDDENFGVEILKKSCLALTRSLLENSCFEAGPIIKKIQESPLGMGLNLNSGKMEDLNQCMIWDPVKVLKGILRNAASCAGTVFSTESVVGNLEEVSD